MCNKNFTYGKCALMHMLLLGTISFCIHPSQNVFANEKKAVQQTIISLPESYGSMNKAVKNQLPFGTCWVFAGIGTMEYAADKNEAGNHIFSEEEMLQSFTKRSNTGWQLTDKNDGGDMNMAAGYLVSHGASNSSVPYDTKHSMMRLPFMNESIGPTYRATDIKFFPKKYKKDQSLSDELIKDIKESVYKNGSAAVNINWNYLYLKKNALNNQDPESREQNDHAVVIIGWDDNYDKSNFIHAERNGAFLVRNSWGSNMGDHGYYWVSYEDKSIDPVFTIDHLEKESSNETVYNLEEGALCKEVEIPDTKTAGFINVFSLKGKERLDKVSFYTNQIGGKYQICYVPFDENGKLNMGQMKMISSKKNIAYEGYHTEPINQKIVKNGKVAIMVIIQSAGNTTSIGAEGARSPYYVPTISKGESYLINESEISDMYQNGFGNWTIKLTTQNADDQNITVDGQIKSLKGFKKNVLGLQKITNVRLKKHVSDHKRSLYPKVTVSADGIILKKGRDYSLKYEDNQKIGKARVVITGKGIYYGTISKNFWIHPNKVKALKIRKKKCVTMIRFKKDHGASGYRIQYSTQKNMKRSKYIFTKKNRYKIKTKKKLYVRVQPYKIVNKKKLYSLK